MNADELLRHFERVVDAPEALPRLRQLVLDLAVRGKLLPQQPGDHPQAKALAAARSELSERAKATGRLRFTPSTPINEADIGDELPPGWVAARVNDTGLYINGLAFKPSDWRASGLPIIRIQNLSDDSREFNYAQGEFADEVLVRPGDILVSWSATLDAYLWKRETGVLNQHIFRVIQATGLTESGYLLLLLKRAIRDLSESVHAHGLVMTHINRGPFLNHVVWIPPLAEQRRIVAKVDELMALCDRLEAARAEREVARDRLTAASLARLHTPDAETFREDARFALQSLPSLTTRPDQISQLRRTILNLGVRGLLTTSTDGDGVAADLLASIDEWKLQLGPSSRKKKPGGNGVLPVLDEGAKEAEEGNFALPNHWCWASAGSVSERIESGSTPPSAEMFEGSGDVPFIKVYNLTKTGQLDFSVRPTFVSRQTHTGKLARSRILPGDVLMNIVGPPLGKVSVVPDIHPEWNTNQAVVLFRPAPGIVNRYLAICLMSDAVLSWITELAQQTVGQVNISVSKCRRLPMPIPPTSEQHRIVAKVDKLMALCDQLEAALAAQDSHRRELLESLLHEALAPGPMVEEVA